MGKNQNSGLVVDGSTSISPAHYGDSLALR